MTYNDLATLAWLILVFIITVSIGYLKYKDSQKPLPKFCWRDGCPMGVYWITMKPIYNENTGEGKIREEKYWGCTVSEEHRRDYSTYLNEERFIPAPVKDCSDGETIANT